MSEKEISKPVAESIAYQEKMENVSPITFRPDDFENLSFCVYRYIDVNDEKIKYVGICNKGTLPGRHRGHMADDWFKNGLYVCEYIKLRNQTETEAMESHLISAYGTDKFFNKAKAGWGEASFIKTPLECDWKLAPWYDAEYFKESAIKHIELDCILSAKEDLRMVEMIKEAMHKYRSIKQRLTTQDCEKRPEEYGIKVK